LIDENGEQMGIMSAAQAQSLADERQLDLVKIAPNAKPPVCKLMDYSKFRFDSQKKEKEARKNQKITQVKEVRLSPTIDTHDIEVKAKACVRFLKGGDKVKVTIRFRGRQLSFTGRGTEIMNGFYEMVKDSATMERKPLMEGRNMVMVLAPANN